jgi:hypothetical protein
MANAPAELVTQGPSLLPIHRVKRLGPEATAGCPRPLLREENQVRGWPADPHGHLVGG